MLDWDLYGNNPSGHHLTNLYLHGANAVLLFLFLFYMTGYLGRSAIVAFLFAVHPAHVESVAWLAERKDVLCAFFWFATLFAYAWYVRRPSWKRFAWVILRLCLRSHVQANGRHASVCSATARLLAVAQNYIRQRKRAHSGSLPSVSYALKNGRSSSWRLSPASSPFLRSEPAAR